MRIEPILGLCYSLECVKPIELRGESLVQIIDRHEANEGLLSGRSDCAGDDILKFRGIKSPCN